LSPLGAALQHYFDTEVAELFHDANIAAVFTNICFWIAHNKANNKNRQKIAVGGEVVERYFTFNSIEAFTKLFPYYSRRQIENYLVKLREHNLIAKGVFNQRGFDRTSWYCLVDEEYWMGKYLKEGAIKPGHDAGKRPISPNGEMDSPKTGNGFHKTGKWIPPKREMDFPKRGNQYQI
jgi:hypothetical protein